MADVVSVLLALIAKEHMDTEHMDIYTEFIDLLIMQTGTMQTGTMQTGTMQQSVITTPLPVQLPYAEVEILAQHLTLQLHALERRGYSLLFWQPEDIWLVNNTFYLLVNLTHLVPLRRSQPLQLFLAYPLILPKAACAPEVLQMTALPFIAHRSCSYYSLALLCLRLLCLQQLNLSLESLQGTKLYYFFERCMKENPEERRCLQLF
jgi:hypothetical protein